MIRPRGVASFHNRIQNSPAMYHLQLSAPRQDLLVIHTAMTFKIVATGSTCKASTSLVEAASSQCRATHRQKSSWSHRQIIAPRALGLGRVPAPPLSSQHPSELHRVSALRHSLDTLITPHRGPQVDSEQIRKCTAASLALLPLLLRGMQPSAASAEALATDLQQASGVDGENIISSAREAVSLGGFNGMTVTDSITTVLFVLAVGALLILTLGVSTHYLSSYLMPQSLGQLFCHLHPSIK